MKILRAGHKYALASLHGKHEQELQFVQNSPSVFPCDGVLNQEVLRVLIDRVKFLDNELPWDGNEKILYHLRAALVLHEQRALMRKLEKGVNNPENVVIDTDGHFRLTYALEEYLNDTENSTGHK